MKINGEMRYLWRAVDHEGEVLETFVTKKRDKAAALKFIKRHEAPRSAAPIVTDRLRSYGAAMKEIGAADRHEVGGRSTIELRIRISRSDDGSGRCSGFGG